MPFKPKRALPDWRKLIPTLTATQQQSRDYLLYQTIIRMLETSQQSQEVLNGGIGDVSITVATLADAAYLTAENESADLPNSRQLLAGTNITFDDTVVNQRTISATGSGANHVPMSTGAEPLEIMSDGAGHVLLVQYNV
jgi:hypothetical protein